MVLVQTRALREQPQTIMVQESSNPDTARRPESVDRSVERNNRSENSEHQNKTNQGGLPGTATTRVGAALAIAGAAVNLAGGFDDQKKNADLVFQAKEAGNIAGIAMFWEQVEAINNELIENQHLFTGDNTLEILPYTLVLAKDTAEFQNYFEYQEAKLNSWRQIRLNTLRAAGKKRLKLDMAPPVIETYATKIS